MVMYGDLIKKKCIIKKLVILTRELKILSLSSNPMAKLFSPKTLNFTVQFTKYPRKTSQGDAFLVKNSQISNNRFLRKFEIN